MSFTLRCSTTVVHVYDIRHIGSVALKVAYGYDTQPKDDPMVHLALKAMVSSARATTPGAFLVELIPPSKLQPFLPSSGSFDRV